MAMKLNQQLTAKVKAAASKELTAVLRELMPEPTGAPKTKSCPTPSPKSGSGGKSKFKSSPVVVDGRRFDSKREAKRWQALKAELIAGRISGLRCQVRFPLKINGVKVAVYCADFVYVRDNRLIVEDVKSAFTAKLPVYRLKKKMMLAIHGIEIQEVR